MRDLPGKSDNLDPCFLTRGNCVPGTLWARSKASAKAVSPSVKSAIDPHFPTRAEYAAAVAL